MTVTWTQLLDPLTDRAMLPAWFCERLMRPGPNGAGPFGLLLSTGDMLRVTSLSAAHLSSGGTVLLDVVLDHAGVPDGVDTAWRSKHYLGLPVEGAGRATVNLAHVVAVVGFAAEAEMPLEAASDEASATVVELRHAAEQAAGRPAS
jgi:hypothetical protein